jgi:hypothetical protein
MSLNNFIPEVWSANVLSGLQKAHVAAAISNRSYEGDIRQGGDTVKINTFADPTIASYVKNSTSITPQNLTAAQREIKVDQSKYFAFEVDDIDARQANMGLMAEPLARAGYLLADTADAFLLGKYAEAGHAQNSDGTPVDLTSLNIDTELLAIGESMDLAGVPKPGRFVIVAPWVHTKAVLCGLLTKTQNDEMFANGFVGKILGFDMLVSANVSKNSASWDKTRNIAGIRGMSLAYVEQILKTEAYRPENSFSDALKGLHVYGGKVLRPDMTWVWYADYTAEA